MAAVYPTSVATFTAKRDNTDAVIASDVNLAYVEITAVETTLGTLPEQTAGWTGSFDQTTTDFTTVANRIQNIEYGLNTAYNSRVKVGGGSTIASTGTTVGLTLSTAGTGNLLVAGNTTINSSGNIVLIDGGTA